MSNLSPEVEISCSCGGNNPNCFKCDGRGTYTVEVKDHDSTVGPTKVPSGTVAAKRHKVGQSVPSRTTSKRYDNVGFHFTSVNVEDVLKGTVIIRANEMVLDINNEEGDSTYLITGSLHGNYFKGMNALKRPAPRVEARWADLGGVFVGLWAEDGEDQFFSFDLTGLVRKRISAKRR